MFKKIVMFFICFLTYSLNAMQPEESQKINAYQYVPQAACPYPFYLINESDEILDIEITTTPNIVTEKNAHILKAILAALTVVLPCDNLNEITDPAIVTKFKRAKFQFSIKPHDNLLLPGIATGQKISIWKKRLNVNVMPYELPINVLEDISKFAQGDKKAIVKVSIIPCSSYGFEFQYNLEQKDNQNLNSLVEKEMAISSQAIELPICSYPVRLVNNGKESLDITLEANPSSLINRNGKFLQLALIALTASIDLDGMNDVLSHNIKDKFKKAQFDFTLNPDDKLLLPGIASQQKIIAWKKRKLLPLIPYELPFDKVEKAVRYIDLNVSAKNIVYMFIEPGNIYGFSVDVSIYKE